MVGTLHVWDTELFFHLALKVLTCVSLVTGSGVESVHWRFHLVLVNFPSSTVSVVITLSSGPVSWN